MTGDHLEAAPDVLAIAHTPVTGRPVATGSPLRESDLVAPLRVGRPRWRRRFAQAAMASDGAALASLPIWCLLWHTWWHVGIALSLVAATLAAVVTAGAGRAALHGWVRRLRRRGRAMSSVLAIGTVDDVAVLVARTRDAAALGWCVRGACTSTGAGDDDTASTIAGVPVVGDLDAVASVTLLEDYDAVAVGPAPGWTTVRLHRLARDLDHSRTALLVDPTLVKRVGPGTRVAGVAGLPLLRLEHPRPTRLVRATTTARQRMRAFVG